ncbi:uncharacterized protein RHIMIDRAFT_237774 [Rhizopus microsporus ATCC 52813]|uniref:Uncharacterized protein n=1 Tax=Rhizopus microsporus ATCC 52813 TaxID=1340429 RepID=A0A2G4ST78_RHIZD|nr:uncharacterized protein RHIMIDRAFT_237774 [Rhizopus microsporus ATCC 52813]PHZ11955.1 hypothetical protein RHIMIDRAFT_237774 [Rhizopus microsporus ATCC 52813]
MSAPNQYPDDIDWPVTIFLNIILICLVVGMCFLLKRANRLIPNRFSFPLVTRQGGIQLGQDEERGLMSGYSDDEYNDAEVIVDQYHHRDSPQRNEEDELEARLAEDRVEHTPTTVSPPLQEESGRS